MMTYRTDSKDLTTFSSIPSRSATLEFGGIRDLLRILWAMAAMP